MKYQRHTIAIDLINVSLQFILAYLILTVILHFFDSDAAIHTLTLLPAPFFSYAIRKFTRHIWSFLLLHLTMITIYLFAIHRIDFLILATVYLIFLMILSYYQKHKAPACSNTSIYCMLLFLFLYLCCYIAKIPTLMQLCFVLSVVFVLLYLLNNYLLNLDTFVRDHAHITGVPYQQIKDSNNVLTAFLLGIFLLVMLLFSRLPLGTAALALGRQLLRLIKYLFSFLSYSEPEQTNDILPQEQENGMDQLPVTEPSHFMELLSQIFQWVATIALVAGAILLILYLVYQIYRYFYLKGEEVKDEVEFISPFTKKERLKREPKAVFRTLFGKSNNALIRKHFVKAVTTHLDSGKQLPKSLTPAQLSEYAFTNKSSDSSITEEEERRKKLLTDYYEKARYSKEECSKEEVQQVKNLLK